MKKDGRKVIREYGSWLRAEGPGFQVSKGKPSYVSSTGESSSNFSSQGIGAKSASKDILMGGGFNPSILEQNQTE